MNEQEWREAARQHFGFDQWPRPLARAAEDAVPQVRGFALLPPDEARDEAGAWIFERRAAYDPSGYTDFFRQPDHPHRRAEVSVHECASHDEARLALLDRLSHCTAVTVPRLTEVALGDVAFKGHGDFVSFVSFVRHNLMITIRSIGDEPVSVLPLATLVDRQIQDQARPPTG
ncbi:hypothetical protein [Pararhodospirillum oryzae]|uniref:Uncharacterized protein n=1 Tax=Pararhodospirillum oryzae TaxID=478448 RepID=A0A512HBK7_9PROT|nr:hypothetical protein [Pararhodospirillum oryzae]GEO82780.1 hypothetical protein ROR02_29110 [Pararhodospirillum oryzae]